MMLNEMFCNKDRIKHVKAGTSLILLGDTFRASGGCFSSAFHKHVNEQMHIHSAAGVWLSAILSLHMNFMKQKPK